jgi:gliding motility-associated-like protein
MDTPDAAFSTDGSCSGLAITFTDSLQGNPVYWQWDFGDGSPLQYGSSVTHTFPQGGSYWIVLIDTSASGCTDTLGTLFTVNQAPVPTFTVDEPVCTGEVANITYTGNAGPGAIFYWDFGGGQVLSGEGAGPYEILWPGNGTYTVSLAISENNCGTDTIRDTIEMRTCEITVPNIFTPNNDGKNDVFFIRGLDAFDQSLLEIYNRWGKLIYKNEDYQNNWTGEDHADGVYYYVLTLQTGEGFHGTVTLMR